MTVKKFTALFFAALLWPLTVFSQVEVPATITFDDPPPWAGGGSAYSQRLEMHKVDQGQPVFKRVGSTVVMVAGTEIEFQGQLYTNATDQAVTLPTLVAGTDYRIALKADGGLQAYTYAAALPEGAKVLGGFHYLPGGYPTGNDQGGNWTPVILEWSMWDINYRPKCEPRGMTRIGNSGVWMDIYFQGNSSNADGISRNNDTILTGFNPPVVAADYGGNGTTKYSTMDWWEANEHLRQWGKRLPSYEEMVLGSFGTNESVGRGAHPVKTGLNTANQPAGSSSDANFTSKWGRIQSTGVLWVWTSTLSDWEGVMTTNANGRQAYDVTGGRGKLLMQNDADLTALLHGGSWAYMLNSSTTGSGGAISGSRSTETLEKIWASSENIGIVGACDHFTRY